MIKLAWVDVRLSKAVDTYDAKAELNGHEARVHCYTRFGTHPWTAEAGGKTSSHRTRESAETAAERRLRAAAVVR
ncbi:hypothetical protein [Sorangium sp. So ce233]|uniref:hypothetical protein n=1 Tax=Sorangium sp. So ce233 TaxID=3133290 RepID=UPI003F5FB137